MGINSFENLEDKYKEPEIRLIDKNTDLSKLELNKLNWDVSIRSDKKDAYRISGFIHATGGHRGIYDIWVCPRGQRPTIENLVAWNGTYGVRWGFSINSQNYERFKWNSDSCETNIKIIITRNDLVFDEFFANDLLFAIAEVSSKVIQYKEFCVDLNCQNFEGEFINRKIFWRDEPAIITSYVDGQACVMIKPDGITSFKSPCYNEGEDRDNFNYEAIKSEILSDHIWWFRE